MNIDWAGKIARAQEVVRRHLSATPLVRVDVAGFDAPRMRVGNPAADRGVQGAWCAGGGVRGFGARSGVSKSRCRQPLRRLIRPGLTCP